MLYRARLGLLSLLGCAALFSLMRVQTAEAAFILTLDDSSIAGVEVTCPGSPGCTSLGGQGFTYAGAAGTWLINVTTFFGLSNPPSFFDTDLNSFDVSSPSTLTITGTETGLITIPGLPATLVSQIGGTLGTGLTLTAVQCVPPHCVSLGPFATGGFTGTGSTAFTSGSPFSITETVVITSTGSSSFASFNFESILTVPEPATLVLLGTGFLLVATLLNGSRRSRKLP
jgi:hypothetical protein